ncbi:MAG: metal-dependent phosphohydrolase [Treponema sp.]|nr:metal-dependent phosphohydrolase [Treponema sp.]
MLEKEVTILLSKILTQQGTKGNNLNYIDIIQEEEIPVLCVNKAAQKKRLMPFKTLFDNNNDFWHMSGSWEYYLTEEGYNKLKSKLLEKRPDWNVQKKPEEKKEKAAEPAAGVKMEMGFGSEYKTYAEMTAKEKIECLNNDKNRLNEILLSKTKDNAVVTEVLVDTTKDAAMINHATIEEAINLADDEAKKLTQDLVDSTQEMVKSSAQLISENVFSNELMNTLVEKSNGTIIQHMTRVYLNGIAFLSYYNNLVSTSSAIQRLRISFATKYRTFYHKLLPHMNLDDIVLERVFYRGMRAIPPELYFKWAVGFLIHDIGKAGAVEYHEGEALYDRKIVIDHVKQGYKSIMTKTNYPMEASLMTGYHHEYYGDVDGYGYFRAYLQQYKKANPDAKQDYCITYELEPILDYQALAYFPAKVLEIIDVYDSVTDPLRTYRKALSSEEALNMMKEQFVEKQAKIDAILFDIFSTFIREKNKQGLKQSA